MGSIKNVVATAVERCGHLPGVPMCEPCIEHALRRAYAAGAKAVEERTEEELIRNFQAGWDAGARDVARQAMSTLVARRVARPRDSRLVDAALDLGELTIELLRQHEQVKLQVQRLYEKAYRLHRALEVARATIEWDEAHECCAIVYVSTVDGSPTETRFDVEYLSGAEWRELAQLHAMITPNAGGTVRAPPTTGG